MEDKNNLVGKVFGEFKVVKQIRDKNNKLQWLCVCSCGTERLKAASELLQGKVKSCINCATKFRPKQSGIEDLSGRQYNYLTVIEYIKRDEAGIPLWLCKCNCGNTTIVNSYKLKKLKDNSCGCVRKKQEEVDLQKLKKRKEKEEKLNLLGKQFNYYTVIDKSNKLKNGKTTWVCKCICGNIKEVEGTALTSGNIKSCGCTRHKNKKEAPINKKINHLTLIKEIDSKIINISKRNRRERKVQCLCDCGNTIIINLKHFNSGKYKSCGCKNIRSKKDLSTITSLGDWSIIKQESKNTWLCQCTNCKTTRILSYKFLIKEKVCNCKRYSNKVKNQKTHIGEMFGDLLIIDKINTTYKCECYCGNIITTKYYKLKSGAIKDCGCVKCKEQEQLKKQRELEFINKKFGRLLVLSRVSLRYGGTVNKPFWSCLCECGKTKIVSTSNLLNNNTRSCGCLQFEIAYQGIHFGAKRQKERDKLRNTKKYKNWRISIFKRDNNVCQICNNYFETENLRAHHLLAFSKYKNIRYEKNNGITMCVDCHNTFHNIYTSTNFDINNFVQFKKQYDHQLK